MYDLKIYGPCWLAPGVLGFDGKGYWFHKFFRMMPGFDFHDAIDVKKTSTLNGNTNNMDIAGPEKGYGPRNLFPRCIAVRLWSGETWNSVGLAGPSLKSLFQLPGFIRQDVPTMLSLMSPKHEKRERLAEIRQVVQLIREEIPIDSLPIAFQLNLSCPNTGLNPDDLVDEGVELLEIMARIKRPKILKFNIFAPPKAMRRISEHPECAGLCATNCPASKDMAKFILNWNRHHLKSPLELRDQKFGSGGYSGTSLLPIVADWNRRVRDEGVTIPINLGGGIRHPDHVDFLVEHGLLRRGIDSIFFASAAMVRPWQVQPIIRRAHQLLG
ncbi:MAG: hypothetical protein Q7R54_01115 [bacterium]|nr:hypothetical protein [bacterium]